MTARNKVKRLLIWLLLLAALVIAGWYAQSYGWVFVALTVLAGLLIFGAGYVLGLEYGIRNTMQWHFEDERQHEKWRAFFEEYEAERKAKARKTEYGRWKQEEAEAHAKGLQ